jgi:hypothetical protein
MKLPVWHELCSNMSTGAAFCEAASWKREQLPRCSLDSCAATRLPPRAAHALFRFSNSAAAAVTVKPARQVRDFQGKIRSSGPADLGRGLEGWNAAEQQRVPSRVIMRT